MPGSVLMAASARTRARLARLVTILASSILDITAELYLLTIAITIAATIAAAAHITDTG